MFFLVLLEWVDIYLYLCRCLSHLWLPLHEQNGYSHLFVPLLTWSEDGRQHSSLWDQTFFNRQSGIVATGRGLCVNQCLNESLSSPGGMNGSFHPLHTITHAQQNHTHTHTYTHNSKCTPMAVLPSADNRWVANTVWQSAVNKSPGFYLSPWKKVH